MKKIKRMHQPLDALAKRQSAYAADVIHEFLGFPGEYIGPLANEYPNADGSIPRVDSSYCVKLNGKKYVLDREDETMRVDIRTVVKINGYRVNLEYAKVPVISVITTDLPLDKCTTSLEVSPSLTFKPIIKSYLEYDGCKRFSIIGTKIRNNEVLSNVEAMNLIMIPRMLGEVPPEILEELCQLLKMLKLKNFYFKIELIFEMKCIIHKYAKTELDIYKLEKVIGLQEAMTAMEYQQKLLVEQGVEQGVRQGSFDLALKLLGRMDLEEVAEISGFSIEELENRKLNYYSPFSFG